MIFKQFASWPEELRIVLLAESLHCISCLPPMAINNVFIFLSMNDTQEIMLMLAKEGAGLQESILLQASRAQGPDDPQEFSTDQVHMKWEGFSFAAHFETIMIKWTEYLKSRHTAHWWYSRQMPQTCKLLSKNVWTGEWWIVDPSLRMWTYRDRAF